MSSPAPLAPDHKGMRCDLSHLLMQVRDEIKRSPRRGYYRGAIEQLEQHLMTLAGRFYAGDLQVVDEFLQAYCLAGDSERAYARQAADAGAEVKKTDDWTRGALYALALAARQGEPTTAEEGLNAMGIRTLADLKAAGLDEYDASPLRKLLWRKDRPAAPSKDAVMHARRTGDTWSLFWLDYPGGYPAGDIEWPFGDDELSDLDLDRLGFDVLEPA